VNEHKTISFAPWVLIFVLLISSCSPADQMPAEAQKVVEDQAAAYYTNPVNLSDPFDSISKVTLVKAWLAKGLPDQPNNVMWCVEINLSGQKLGSSAEQQAVWIAVPNEQKTGWIAAALETISADMTYKRCGQTPPGL
jgi:hypothetical protein